MERRTRRRIVVTVGGLVLLWMVAAAWSLLSARSAMTDGAQQLRAVRRRATIASLVEPERQRELAAAEADFDRAAARLDSPLLWPVRVIPVASRHLAAARDVATASQEGTAAADEALTDLRALSDRPRDAGPERVATVRELSAVATRAATVLREVDPGSPDALVGPLADAVVELDEQRDDAVAAADDLARTSRAVADVLAGPTPYLLLGANNAEMRAGSGMYLSAAELGFADGALTLGDVRPTAELVLPAGSVPATGDLAANWPWLEPGRDLRNLGLTADFPQNAALAVETWAQVPGTEPVAGVVAIDVDGLRSLLRVVGPVTVDGVRYSADTVRGELLRAQYSRFADDRDARRDQLGEVARAVFEQIEAGNWELTDLAAELSDAVAGRHLLIWSTDERAQEAWKTVGADGHLDERSLSVALVNRSATKLDSWVETAVDVDTSEGSGGGRRITVTYEVANTATGDGPPYVAGPNVDGLTAGDHRALAVVNLPAGSTDVRLEGARQFLVGGDGPTVVVAGEFTVAAGDTASVTVTALLPPGLDRITLEPAARVPRTRWTIDGTTFERDRRQSVPLN